MFGAKHCLTAENQCRRSYLALMWLCIIGLGMNGCGRPPSQGIGEMRADAATTGNSAVVKHGNFRHILRLSGTVEAVESHTV